MRVVFMGTPQIAADCLSRLIADGFDLVGVYTKPDMPKNRGMKLAMSEVKEVALAADLPVYQPATFRDDAAVEELRALRPDVIAVVAYGKILPQRVLDIPKLGCINIHTSILPALRGSAPAQWAILNGLDETGVTAMYLSAGMDEGDIIEIRKTPIEPLDNYDNVRRFLELVNSPEGLNIGMRHISLSTCGLVDQIDRLAEEDLQLTLSVSLHAPVDEVRSSIMPVNRRWPVQELLDACRRYFEKTGRRISFEYAMIRDVNDTPEMAKQLIRRLRGIAAHVNLIPLNDVAESPLKPSLPETVLRFQKTLEASGIPATVRRTLGSDINASCGQLRRNYEAEKPKEGSGMDGSVGTDGHGKRA